MTSVGYHAGPGDVEGHQAMAVMLGPTIASDALDERTWDTMLDPWVLDRYAGWVAQVPGRRLALAVPMLPRTDAGRIDTGAWGAYDYRFDLLARNLVTRGLAATIIRLGWEANGTWYPWSAAPSPLWWRTYYRRIVFAMRSVHGQAFAFDFCLAAGGGGASLRFAALYPGDDVVDFVGLDNYDLMWNDSTSTPEQRWDFALTQPNGLNEHRDFAAAHAKPMSFPEWGLYRRGDSRGVSRFGGGGDSPFYVDRMADWFEANDVAYHSYFDQDWGGGRLVDFPRAQARYRARFGR